LEPEADDLVIALGRAGFTVEFVQVVYLIKRRDDRG
jgi:hypothetical protein